MSWNRDFFFLPQGRQLLPSLSICISTDNTPQPPLLHWLPGVHSTGEMCGNSQQFWIVRTCTKESQVGRLAWKSALISDVGEGAFDWDVDRVLCSPQRPLQWTRSGEILRVHEWVSVLLDTALELLASPVLTYSMGCRLSWHSHSFFPSCLWVDEALRDWWCLELQPGHYERN